MKERNWRSIFAAARRRVETSEPTPDGAAPVHHRRLRKEASATEASRLGRNFTAVAVASLVSQLLALVVSISLARTLGVADYGLFAFAFYFPQWFTIILDLGLDSVLTIDVAADRSRSRDYMTAVALIRVVPLVAGIGALWLSLQFALSDPFARLVTFIFGVSILIATVSQLFSGVFRAFERMEYIALITLLGQILTTGGVLGLLFLGYGLLPIAVVYLIVSVVNTIVAMYLCHRKFSWFTRSPKPGSVRHVLRTTWPFAADDMVSAFMTSSGPVLLTLLLSSTATGIFNAAFGLMSALRYPLTQYYFIALPTMSRFHSERNGKLGLTLRKSQKLFFIFGLPMTIGGWFYRDAILRLFYGPGFEASGASFGILVFAVGISTAAVGVGMTLAATGRQKINMTFGLIGAAINLGLCLFLIPTWGPEGAAIAFLCATAFTSTAGMIAVHKLVTRVDVWGTMARPSLACGMMFLVLSLTNLPFYYGVPLGAAVYFPLLLLLRGFDREDWNLLRQVTRGALFR